MEVDENIRTLLAAGVGIWSSEINCELYNKTVLELASDGKLSYLIADKSICYGTNYPFDGVIIAEDFEQNTSINTRFQTCSRTARPDKSWKGVVYISNNFAKEILDYVKNPNPINIEAVNMENMYNQIIDDGNRLVEKYALEYEKEMLEKQKASEKIFKIPTIQFISNRKKVETIQPINNSDNQSSNPYRRKKYTDQVKTDSSKQYKPLEVVRNKTADTNNNWRQDSRPKARPVSREPESYRKINFD